MSQRPIHALRRLLLYWAAGLLMLAMLWVAPITRRLAAGLVRLAIVAIAPTLPATSGQDPAEPTWMFVLCVGVAGALLGLLFFAAGRLLRPRAPSAD